MACLPYPISRNTKTDQMFTSNGLGSALGDEKWIFSKKDLVHNNLIRIENPIRALKSTEQFRLVFVHNLAAHIVPKVSATVNNDSGPRKKTHQIADQKSSIFVTGSFFVLLNDCLVTDGDGCWSHLPRHNIHCLLSCFCLSIY